MIKTNKQYDICIIGGGASGLMAAALSASRSRSVCVVERNGDCGRKLAITGKGRCNVTNNCTVQEFLENVPNNPRFLYAALSAFSPQDVIDFFESHGVPLKTERGRRVFPQSDSARDIVNCLVSLCRSSGVDFVTAKAKAVLTAEGAVCGVRTDRFDIDAKSVILACGGASYPATGSDGSGYALAAALGHTIVPPKPSLVPLCSSSRLCADCMGLSLKNVGVKFIKNSKTVYEEQGEMLFTHFGVSGPVILSASSHLRDAFPYEMYIDMKPALDEQALDARLLRDFSSELNKDFVNSLSALLPQKLIQPFTALTGIDAHKKINSLTKAERSKTVSLMKAIPVTITGARPISEAIITSGGVNVREVSPKTMESKLIKNLFFAGEILDVDAYTGGYNLQIAWSTAFLAARAAGE